jgi:hypothetical protein
VLLAANLEFIRSLEFDWFCGGHGNIGEKSDVDFYPEWTAARQQAVDEAVPKIIERLRPKYGRMYDFDDAQPFNVRLMAMDMQVTMSNR